MQYPPNWFSCGRDAVPGPQVPLEILKRAVAAAKSPQEAASAQNRLDKLLKNRLVKVETDTYLL